MTVRVIPIERARGRGRQPAELEALRDLRDELTALLAEDLEHGRELLALTRSAMGDVAAGRSPADHLAELERRVLRLIYQRKSASAAFSAEAVCPCGSTVRHLGCGVAA